MPASHNIVYGIVFEVCSIYQGNSHWATAGY